MISLKTIAFGSSFNPPHIGHLAIIKSLLGKCKQLLVIPCGQRKDKFLEKDQHRLEMLKLMLSQFKDDQIKVIDYEIKRGQQIRTFQMMRILREQRPNEEIYFVIGSDLVPMLPSWSGYKQLIAQNKFIVYQRKGFELKSEQLQPLGLKDSILMDQQIVDISSSQIRQLISQGADIKSIVTQKVAEYIFENKLFS